MALLRTPADPRPRPGPTQEGRSAGDAHTLGRRALAWPLAAGALLLPVLAVDGAGSALALLLLGGLLATGLAAPADRPGRLPVLGWAPAGLLLAMLCVTAVGLAAAALDVPLWGSRAASLLTWSGLVLAVLGVSQARGARVRPADGPVTVVVTVLPLVAVAAALAARPFEVWSRIVAQGTDFARHALIVRQTAEAGLLDYAADAYPRSAHASLALLQSAAGDASYVGAWQSTEVLLLIMYALLGTATALLAVRIAQTVGVAGTAGPAVAAGSAMVLALVGPWTIGLLSGGFLTSVQAALIIGAGALLVWESGSRPSVPGAVSLILLCASMAHAWLLLLPVIAAPTAVVALPLLRHRRTALPVAAATTVGLAVTAPVLWASLTLLGVGSAAAGGDSGLPFPGPLWLGLFLLAGCGVWGLSRAGAVLPTRAMLALLTALVASLLFLAVVSGEGEWTLYYLIKSAWTPIAVLLGLAVPGAILLLGIPGGRARPAVVLIASALAASAALAPLLHAGRVLINGSIEPPLVIPLLEQLEQRHPDPRHRPEVVVWGLTPFIEVSELGARRSGFVDYVALSALYTAGFAQPAQPIGGAVLEHDPIAVCRHLAAHPEAIRVTGPYPQGPLQWLADAGCPADAVRAEDWITVSVDPEWFTGTRHEGRTFGDGYPGWAELRRLG